MTTPRSIQSRYPAVLKEYKGPSSPASPSFPFSATSARRPRRPGASPAHQHSTRNSGLGSDEARAALRMQSIHCRRTRGQAENDSQIALGSQPKEGFGYW